jgi:serine/threonine protein kinase
MDEGVSDLDLPLVPITEHGSISGMRRRDLQPNGSPWPPLDCFDSDEWSPASLAHFDRQQWHMLAPFFSLGRGGQIKHYPLHDHHILPFITRQKAEEEETTETHGGYGKVFMVHMHPAHHKLAREAHTDRGFAVKQLLVNDRKCFRRERRMLKKFGGTNSHPHIVSLLATYSHRGKYHFVFDRAQSDLGNFWQKYEESLKMSHSDVYWISEQCQGLADGLFKIHMHKTFRVRRVDQPQDQGEKPSATSRVTFAEVKQNVVAKDQPCVKTHGASHATATPSRTFSSEIESTERYAIKYGRHGDINPQNILLFDDGPLEITSMPRQLRGTLKIADFGTAEMHSTYSKSGERDVANTLTYRPPECDAADRTIRQSFDIWCLGCVFLEFATWMLGGEALVRRFAKKRLSRDMTSNSDQTDTYFELLWNKDDRRTEARVKPSVVTVFCPFPAPSRLPN